MGGNFDETTLQTGKKPSARNREKIIMEIVGSLSVNNGGVAEIFDVFNEAERYDIDRATAEDIIENLNRVGRLLRPSGYNTLQIA
jgi:DNA replicative helicase MCM subunit Mcm2 (Cdc46/Mcm family)